MACQLQGIARDLEKGDFSALTDSGQHSAPGGALACETCHHGEMWGPPERGGQQGGAGASARSAVRVLPSTSCRWQSDWEKITQQASCICSPKCFLKGTRQEGGRNTSSGRGESLQLCAQGLCTHEGVLSR